MATKIVNGKVVKLTKAEEKKMATREIKHAKRLAREAKVAYKEARAREYPPVGDQLDAILHQLNNMRLQGVSMVQPVDDIIGKWLAVKQKHPKPPEE